VPELVARYVKLGLDVVVERGAGAGAFHADEAFAEKGAKVAERADVLRSDIVVSVLPPGDDDLAQLKDGAVLVGFLSPLENPRLASVLAKGNISAFAMELVPRVSRAQKMDALSAMSSVAGYRAVLLAAETLPKFFPLLTTAAGTVRPASVLVLGAGVAGLQAIATARRLGARVFAYDIRAEVAEQIRSLGGQFVELDLEKQEDKDTGGYASELAEDAAERQVEQLVPHIAKADVVITTALIPGRPAPLLISRKAVESMRAGSVIVDLAAPNGGNCELTHPGETYDHNGVTIMGPQNLPSELSVHASEMYGRTVLALVEEVVKEGSVSIDMEDEVVAGSCLSHRGDIVNERVRGLVAAGG
jgi:NAD(P) transhydrogenase subunit alpha